MQIDNYPFIRSQLSSLSLGSPMTREDLINAIPEPHDQVAAVLDGLIDDGGEVIKTYTDDATLYTVWEA